MKKYRIQLLRIIIVLFISTITAQNNLQFTKLEATETGIYFNNIIKDDQDKNILLYANFYGGAGVGVGDFNNDGLQDVYFASSMRFISASILSFCSVVNFFISSSFVSVACLGIKP